MADAHEEGAGVARSLQCKRPQTIYPVSRAQRAVCKRRLARLSAPYPLLSEVFSSMPTEASDVLPV